MSVLSCARGRGREARGARRRVAIPVRGTSRLTFAPQRVARDARAARGGVDADELRVDVATRRRRTHHRVSSARDARRSDDDDGVRVR